MQKKTIKGFSLYSTDGTRVYNRRGFHVPQSLNGTYKLVADGGSVELTEISIEQALSGGISGDKKQHKPSASGKSKKSKKAL